MTKRYPITLGIVKAQSSKSANKSAADKEAAGKVPLELKKKIFERDDYTCVCCGFKAKKYQEILFYNQNDQDFTESNLATCCIFCLQCFDLEKVSEMRSGVLIWLPEVEQAKLHHIARAIYVARISQGPAADAARKVLDILMQRRKIVKERIGTDDPYILATVLRDFLGPGHYKNRKDKLEGVRLFPLDRRIIKESDLEFNQFPQILAYWRSKDGPFGGKPPPQWISIYQKLKSA